jgi:hypothetical protein
MIPRCVARVLSLALTGISHIHHHQPPLPSAAYSPIVVEVLLPLSCLFTSIVHLPHI